MSDPRTLAADILEERADESSDVDEAELFRQIADILRDATDTIDRLRRENKAFRQAIRSGDGPHCEDVCLVECLGPCGAFARDADREVDDGFGNCWLMCERQDCDLEVVRPGKVQCRGDHDDIGCVWADET